MADVNAGISDLRNWEQIAFSNTTFNIVKSGDKYLVTGTPSVGAERMLYKIQTEKNKKYLFKMTRDATYNTNNAGDDFLFVSSLKIGRTSGGYNSFSDSQKNAILNKVPLLNGGRHTYSLEFNSGDNNELYIEFEFQNVADYQSFSFTFSDISLNVMSNNPKYIIESAYKTGYYFKNGEKIDVFSYMILIADESILYALPKEITTGSWAYTAGGKKVWQLDFDGEWIPAFDEDE